MADSPPLVAGALDDEFADASGGLPNGWSEWDIPGRLTVGEDSAGLTLTSLDGDTDQIFGIYKTIPSGDFTVWTKLSFAGLAQQNYLSGGILLLEDASNSSGDAETFHVVIFNGNSAAQVNYYTAYNAFSANSASQVLAATIHPSTMYLRLRRNGTTYSYEVSSDGLGWIRIFNATLAFTPTQFGLFSSDHSANTYVARYQFFRYLNSDVGLTGLVGGQRL